MKMQKKQFRIGQLADLLELEQFVIRFWEKEFNFTSTRSDGGQRFYEEKDLLRFKAIKRLLYQEGFTIAGAKKKLNDPHFIEQPAPQIIVSTKIPLPQEFSETPLKAPLKKKLLTIKNKLVTLQQEL